MINRSLALLFVVAVFARPAHAFDVQFIPDSHHQQHQTFALFADVDNTSLLWRDAGRAWGSLGGAMALVGSEDLQTQLVAFGTATASYRFNPAYAGLLTETIDAKVGLQLEHPLSDTTRISAGWTHFSGHISDDIELKQLIGPNDGDEFLHVRIVHDIPGLMRFGGTLKPIVGSDPTMMAFAADQFFEVYPFGVSQDIRVGTPYVAASVEEYGPHDIQASVNAQIGYSFGEHMGPKHTQAIRFVAGVYSGEDPRLKYMQFIFDRVTFGYAGAYVDF
jgi:hypothetical protein